MNLSFYLRYITSKLSAVATSLKTIVSTDCLRRLGKRGLSFKSPPVFTWTNLGLIYVLLFLLYLGDLPDLPYRMLSKFLANVGNKK